MPQVLLRSTARLSVVMAFGVLFISVVLGADDEQPPIRVYGTRAFTGAVMDVLCRQWTASGNIRAECLAGNPWGPFDEVVRGQGEVVAHSPFAEGQLEVNEEPPIPPEVTAPMVLGEFRVILVANSANTVRELNPTQIASILAPKDKTVTWEQISERGGKVNVYVEAGDSLCTDVVRWRFLAHSDGRSGGRFVVRDDAVHCSDADDVIKRVSRDVNGVGLFLWRDSIRASGVRVLAISPRNGATAVAPEVRVSTFQPDYPLSRPVLLYIRKDAERRLSDFTKFCLSPEAARSLGAIGLITELSQAKGIAEKRVAEAKAGKGPHVSAVGTTQQRQPMQELATEFARAKAATQLSYAPADADVSSIGAFVTGGEQVRELLVLDEKPSAKAMEKYGEKWNSLGVDKDGKPDGTGPEEFCIAGRATAVIVNGANGIKSITMGQLAAIFSGEADDWNIIGSSGLSAQAGGKGIPIHRFGVPSSDPAAGVFYRNCFPELYVGPATESEARRGAGSNVRPGGAASVQKLTLKKDTADVVAAVSMDPNAIGFVDLTALPGGGLSVDSLAKAGQTVKVLAIQLKIGGETKAIAPTARNVRNAMYPLSQRIFLYVHPKASDTAKDFAKFVATCGGSEATPYADTVKAVMDAYAKNGLIPLGDAALDRLAKDEIEASKAKAEAESAKSTKPPTK